MKERVEETYLSVSIKLLIEAAENDWFGIDVFLLQRRSIRIRLLVLAAVVQVVASPTSTIGMFIINIIINDNNNNNNNSKLYLKK